ncbi:uncharacterized protein LOC144626996 [Crassostrea virginica]
MAFFVFNWTKREYILTLLSLILLVITVNHQEFFLCRETSLNRLEKFGAYLGVLDQPEPCPGIEDLHKMALEIGVSTLAVLGSSVVFPKLWKWTKAALHYGVQSLKNGLNYMKGRWYGTESFPGSFDPDGTGSVGPARATDTDPSAMDGDPPDIYSDPSANDPDPPAMDLDPPADFCTSAAVPPDVPDGGPNSNFYFLRKAYEKKRVILFVKKGRDHHEVFAYNPVTKRFVLKSYFPSQPRADIESRC